MAERRMVTKKIMDDDGFCRISRRKEMVLKITCFLLVAIFAWCLYEDWRMGK